VISFKYRPKKRIRVKGGHRHFYTRLLIDFIGKLGEERKVEPKKEAVVAAEVQVVEAVEEPKVAKPKKASKSSTTKKTEK
jgi:ribosomal protein L21